VAAYVLAAAKAGDQPAVARDSRIRHRNGNQIADFLYAANPRHWPKQEMRAMTGFTARALAWPTCSATGSWR
jgi:hypothetical protein